MSSKRYLNDLVEEDLAEIARLSGVLALHELIKIGNRSLTSKLCSPRATTRYSNITEYGYPTLWSNNLLLQFKGLRCLHLVSGSISGFKLASSPYLLNSLPKTLEVIHLETQDVLESCYIDTEGNLPFDFNGRFSNLISLALLYPDLNDQAVRLVTTTGGDKLRHKWLSDHIAVLPSNLTSLQTNWPFPDLANYLELLPPNLQTLAFSADALEGYSWISVLPLIQALKIYHLKVWKIGETESTAEKALESPLCLKRLELPDLVKAQPASRLFAHIAPKLQELIAPNWKIDMNEACVLTELRKLECSLSFDPSDAQHPQYPPSLIYLKYNPSIGSSHKGEWKASLPGSLQSFECSQIVLSSALASLLPRSLIHLVVGSIEKDFNNFSSSLPQLQYLEEVCTASSQLTGSVALPHPIDQLIHLPTSVNLFKSGYQVMLRAKKNETSIPISSELVQPSGWTHIANACKNANFEEMNECLSAIGDSDPNGVWIRQVVHEGGPRGSIPSSALDWLNKRGVLTNPPKLGSLKNSPLISEAPKLLKANIIYWASEQNWMDFAPVVIESLAHKRGMPILKQLQKRVPLRVAPFLGCNALGAAMVAQEYELAHLLRDAGVDYLTHFGDVLDLMFLNENLQMEEMVDQLRSLKIEKVYFETPGQEVTSRTLMEAFISRITYENLTPAVVDLLDYLVVDLGMDINEQVDDPLNPNISCIMDLVMVKEEGVELEEAWYLKLVPWMLKRGFELSKIKGVTKRGRNYTKSILVVALEMEQLELAKLLVYKGFDPNEALNIHQIGVYLPVPTLKDFKVFLQSGVDRNKLEKPKRK